MIAIIFGNRHQQTDRVEIPFHKNQSMSSGNQSIHKKIKIKKKLITTCTLHLMFLGFEIINKYDADSNIITD